MKKPRSAGLCRPRAQAGYSAPQDPTTLPRGKAAIQKPVAKELGAADLHCQLTGSNPWKLAGGWRLAPAPAVKASGEEISKAGFSDKDWLVATVPGTVLTTMIDRGLYPDPITGSTIWPFPRASPIRTTGTAWSSKRRRPAWSAAHAHLEGVNYAAEVWMNGKKLGGFTGAFLRGTFDVTGAVAATGENALAVRISPPPHPGIAHEQSLKAGPGENGGMEVLDGPTFAAAEAGTGFPAFATAHRHLGRT